MHCISKRISRIEAKQLKMPDIKSELALRIITEGLDELAFRKSSGDFTAQKEIEAVCELFNS
jgi:hypothetical protein